MRTKLAKETLVKLKDQHAKGDESGATVIMDTSKYSKAQVIKAIDELNKTFGHIGYQLRSNENKLVYAVYNGEELER